MSHWVQIRFFVLGLYLLLVVRVRISQEQRTFLVLGTFLRSIWEAATAAKLARK